MDEKTWPLPILILAVMIIVVWNMDSVTTEEGSANYEPEKTMTVGKSTLNEDEKEKSPSSSGKTRKWK